MGFSSMDAVAAYPAPDSHSHNESVNLMSEQANEDLLPLDKTVENETKFEEGIISSQQQHELRSTLSTESEGPTIIIESTSSETDEDALEKFPFKIHNQRLHLVSISDSYSAVSSSTEVTSEGGESEGKRRSLSPSSNETVKRFLEETFSDEGLSNDLFLLKHVNRHRHGFVSLKLLTGYKQVKKLNCDWRTLSETAKQSKALEVDANGRKVRRKQPLPGNLRSVPVSRVVAVVDIQEDLCSMEKLAIVFGKYGPISSLHLLKHKPGGKVAEELQSLAARVPEVAHTTCAIVQFENVWGAAKVMKEFSHETTSLHILLQRKISNRSTPASRGPSTPIHAKPKTLHSAISDDLPRSMRCDWRKRITDSARRDSTGSEAEEFVRPRKHSGHGVRRVKTPQPQNKSQGTNFSNSLPTSPLMRRRIKEGITREPMGPDGSKGFKSTKYEK